MAGNPDEWPEVIAPGAFDAHLPADVPLTDKPGGRRISIAHVTKDETGLSVSMAIPGPGEQKAEGHIPAGGA